MESILGKVFWIVFTIIIQVVTFAAGKIMGLEWYFAAAIGFALTGVLYAVLNVRVVPEGTTRIPHLHEDGTEYLLYEDEIQAIREPDEKS